MSKTIQIRDVPDDLHARLKERAARAGMSLSEFLRRELVQMAPGPVTAEFFERIRQREPVELSEPIEDIIRRDRDSH